VARPTVVDSTLPKDLLGAFALLAAFLLLPLVTPELPGRIFALWSIGGVMIGVLLCIPTRRWWPFIAVTVVGEVAWFTPSWDSTASVAVRSGTDLLVIIGTAYLLTRTGSARLRGPSSVWALAGIAVVAGIVRMASYQAAVALDPAFGTQSIYFRGVLFLGTLLAILVVTPVTLTVLTTRWSSWPKRRNLQRIILPVGVVILAIVVAGSDLLADFQAREFLIVPAMGYAALTLRRRGITVLLTVVTVLIVGSALRSRGMYVVNEASPFAQLEAITLAQTLCLVTVLVTWLIFTLRAKLSSANIELRAIVDQGSTMVESQRPSDTVAHPNAAVFDFFEIPSEDFTKYHFTELTHPDDLVREMQLVESWESGQVDTIDFTKRYLLPNGKVKWGHVVILRVYDDVNEEEVWITQATEITAEEEGKLQLERDANFDKVTGLLSRVAITRSLDRMLTEAPAAGTRVVVSLVDVGDFLVINRALGYEATDESIAVLARRLTGTVPPGSAVGRFDGSLLLVVTPETNDQSVNHEYQCREILAGIGTDLEIRDHHINREAAVGLSVSAPGSSAVSMLREADNALTEARRSPKRWSIYAEASTSDVSATLRLEHELRLALARDELIAYFQPQVRLHDGSIFGYEALVRWQHPQRGLLPPAAFLDVAEETNLSGPLGTRMLSLACQTLRDQPQLPGHIAVNVSPLELGNPDWERAFLDTLADYGVDPSRLVIEFTETTALSVTTDLRRQLADLRERGIGIHVDDFGTGYSSISLLRDLPVTGLKLDRSFVEDIENPDGASLALATGLAGLAHGLGLDMIAEGIETTGQARMLLEAGWTVGQGYLYSQPVPEPPLSVDLAPYAE
jgi:diguanylate cyclase (GGDEF)-like protein